MKTSPTELGGETTMLHACYGNRNERCWAEAITCSAEFAAVSLCNIKSWPVNSCGMVFTLKHTQNNGSFQLCKTQRGFPGCSMKSRSHFFFSSYISPENPPVCLWLCEYVTNNGRVSSTTKTQWKFNHKQIWGRNEQDVNLHVQKKYYSGNFAGFYLLNYKHALFIINY